MEQGIENTGDESIKNEISKLFEEHLSLLLGNGTDYANDFLVGDKPVTDCTLNDVMTAYPCAEHKYWDPDPISESQLHESMIQYTQWVENGMNGLTNEGVVADAISLDAGLNWLSFQHEYSPAFDFRGIALGDSFEDVLGKLGFNDEGVTFLKNNYNVVMYVDNDGLRFSDEFFLDNIKEIYIYENKFHLCFQFEDDCLRQFDYYADT